MPIIAVIMMLVSANGRAKAVAFVLGWLVGSALLATVIVLVSDGAGVGSDDEASDVVNVLLIRVGAALLLAAVRQWRARPAPGEEPKEPKMLGAIDGLDVPRAAAVGALLAAVNPKNLALTAAAAAAIAQANLEGGESAVAVAVFVVIAAAGVALPVIAASALGDRAPAMLADWKLWLTHNGAVIMAVLLAVIGANVLGNGIGGL